MVFIILLFPINSFSQVELDTLRVYNVHCSFSEDISFHAWGGKYSSYYPAEKCPEIDKQKYISNYEIVDKYMTQNKFFWMK